MLLTGQAIREGVTTGAGIHLGIIAPMAGILYGMILGMTPGTILGTVVGTDGVIPGTTAIMAGAILIPIMVIILGSILYIMVVAIPLRIMPAITPHVSRLAQGAPALEKVVVIQPVVVPSVPATAIKETARQQVDQLRIAARLAPVVRQAPLVVVPVPVAVAAPSEAVEAVAALVVAVDLAVIDEVIVYSL